MEKDVRFQILLLHTSRSPLNTWSPDKTKSHLSFKVPGKEAPHPCPPIAAPMETAAPFPQPIVHSFISPHNYHSPQLRKEGENIWLPSVEPPVDRTPTYNRVLPGS